MKPCSKCKETKPFSEFYKKRSHKDGLASCCKSCKNACDKAWQQTEKGRATKAKYRETPKDRAYQAEYKKEYQQSERGQAIIAKYVKAYINTPKGKAVRNKATTRFKAHHPNQIKASSVVNSEIRAGRLDRPDTLQCHYCPKQAEQYHHYLGYEPEFWLDVVPACLECHRKEHRKIA